MHSGDFVFFMVFCLIYPTFNLKTPKNIIKCPGENLKDFIAVYHESNFDPKNEMLNHFVCQSVSLFHWKGYAERPDFATVFEPESKISYDNPPSNKKSDYGVNNRKPRHFSVLLPNSI